jgi:large subunit ribosomal protein L25
LVVLQQLEAVEIKALPAKLPDFLEVPGEKLVEQGDHVTVADIVPVDGVEIMEEPEAIVASVYEPSALAAANDAAGGDAEDEAEVEAENGGEEAPATEAEGEATSEETKE